MSIKTINFLLISSRVPLLPLIKKKKPSLICNKLNFFWTQKHRNFINVGGIEFRFKLTVIKKPASLYSTLNILKFKVLNTQNSSTRKFNYMGSSITTRPKSFRLKYKCVYILKILNFFLNRYSFFIRKTTAGVIDNWSDISVNLNNAKLDNNFLLKLTLFKKLNVQFSLVTKFNLNTCINTSKLLVKVNLFQVLNSRGFIHISLLGKKGFLNNYLNLKGFCGFLFIKNKVAYLYGLDFKKIRIKNSFVLQLKNYLNVKIKSTDNSLSNLYFKFNVTRVIVKVSNNFKALKLFFINIRSKFNLCKIHKNLVFTRNIKTRLNTLVFKKPIGFTIQEFKKTHSLFFYKKFFFKYYFLEFKTYLNACSKTLLYLKLKLKLYGRGVGNPPLINFFFKKRIKVI